MNSKEAFEKWTDNYALDVEPLTTLSRRQDCEAAWNAALEWAAKGQEPFGYLIKPNGIACFTRSKVAAEHTKYEKLYLHPAPIPAGWKLVPIEPTEAQEPSSCT